MKNRLLWLDSLKGIACLIVFFAHIIARYPLTVDYSYGVGKIGVWLFVVSSGYLLLVTAPKELTWKWLGKYYINKLIKIYPGLILGALLLYKAGIIASKTEIVQTLLLMSGPAHLWYVPVILKFYLVAPLFIWVHRKVDSKLILVLGLVAIFLFFALMWPYYKHVTNSIELKWYIPVFVEGIVLYYIPKFEKVKVIVWDIIIVIAGGVIIALTPLVRMRFLHLGPPDYLYNKYILLGALWAIIVMALVQGGYIRRFLEWCKPLQWYSVVNYSFYIVHYPIIFLLLGRFDMPEIVLFIVAFVVSLAFAAGFDVACIGVKKLFGKATSESTNNKERD